MDRAEQFRIAISDATLDDLQVRLSRTRLPHDFANDDWSYGPPREYMAELVAHWRDHYDWRAVEREMNRYPHYRVVLGGVPIHFMHIRSREPSPTPLLLSHGWPWTFWDYRDVIEPLIDPVAHGGRSDDAFDLIIPSLPGFGFSTPVTQVGIHPRSTADLFATLMTDVLGHERYAAAGGDWGNVITGMLGHKYPDRLIGIQLFGVPFRLDLFSGPRPWDAFGEPPASLSADDRATMIDRQRKFASHIAVHVLDAQTLAYGLHDSPVGLLAWLLRRRHDWADIGDDVESRFSKDDLITSAMVYWVNEAFVTTARYYREMALAGPLQPSHDLMPRIQAPTGLSLFEPDLAGLPEVGRQAAAATANVVSIRHHTTGGHFAPAEEPGLVVDDIRDTFRRLRQG